MEDQKNTPPKITREIAEKEVNKWLDSKKISQPRREALSDSIEKLIDCVVSGELVLNNADYTWDHHLLFPIGENNQIKKLTYKNRLNSSDIQKRLQGLKSGDANGMVDAYICALTNEPLNFITKMDTEDAGVARIIVVFFMRG